jgi:type II secretory pathway pseudopilin PulG
VLELLIVLALMGLVAFLGYSGFQSLTSAALVEDTNDLVAVLRRTQVLAVEAGRPARVVLDFDKQGYWVEVCTGDATLRRTKEESKLDPEERAKALEDARRKIALLPAGQLEADSPEAEARMALALAGDETGGRTCVPVDQVEELKEIITGDAEGRALVRKLRTGRDVKLREVWVQHLDDSVDDGQVSVNFFPLGWAEKAIIELGDGRSVHTILLHGATGRLEVIDGKLADPDDHMLRQADGEREKDREEAR